MHYLSQLLHTKSAKTNAGLVVIVVALAFVAGIAATPRENRAGGASGHAPPLSQPRRGAHSSIHANDNTHSNGNSDRDANLHAFTDTHAHTDGDAQSLSALHYPRSARSGIFRRSDRDHQLLGRDRRLHPLLHHLSQRRSCHQRHDGGTKGPRPLPGDHPQPRLHPALRSTGPGQTPTTHRPTWPAAVS